jgi:tRNA(Ile)-lysidine synthase
MADRVELEFRRAADELLPEGSSVLAAVSGGADSTALLHLLARMSAGHRLEIAVGHLDHGLRRGSAADRKFVERAAARLGFRCVSDRRAVADLRRKEESPEEAARRVRLGFLREAAREAGARWIATGHHLDDQAETILMRLARGAGPKSLTGMAVRGPGPFVRPLLRIERAALRRFLARHDLAFREDPTNRDLRFDRNRVRRLVVPLLEEVLNPRAARNLVAAAARMRGDAECLDELALAELGRVVRGRRGGLSLDPARLRGLPDAIGRRVARLALETAGADPRRVAARHVEALLDLARGGRGRSVDLPGKLVAIRRDDVLRLKPR